MVDVVGSFMRGFQAGQGVVDTINQRERRQKLEEREDTAWQQSQEDRKQRLADAQTQRERGETIWQQGQEDRKTRLADAEATRERQKVLQGRQDVQWRQGQEQYQHQKTLQRRQRADQLTKDWLNGMAETGQYIAPPKELEDFYDDNPHLDISNILTPESVIGRQQARQLMQMMAQGQSIDRKDPRLINALNQLFPEIVNNPSLPKTYEGKNIVGRQISAVTMSPDGKGFTVAQKLTLDDGTEVDEAPVTVNRSSEPGDDVVVVPFQLASQRLSSLDRIDLALDDDMKQQLFRSRVMRGLTKAGVNSKNSTQIQKQMLAQLDKINEQEQEALQFAETPQEQNQVKATYQQMRQRTRDTYSEFIGNAGQRPSRTGTNSRQFKSDIQTFQHAAENLGIEWTPEVKAEVEELYREGTDAETIIQALQEEYGGTSDNPQEAQSIVNSLLSDLDASRSGDFGPTYQQARSGGVDIPPPTIQPTQTPTGTQEEIAERARLAQANPRTSTFDVSQAPGLEQAYGAR